MRSVVLNGAGVTRVIECPVPEAVLPRLERILEGSAEVAGMLKKGYHRVERTGKHPCHSRQDTSRRLLRLGIVVRARPLRSK